VNGVSDLVTGEAVVLDLQLARLPSRGLAFAIDTLIQGVVLAGLAAVVAAGVASVDDALAATVLLLVVVAVLIGYPVLFETLTRGRTLGKMALGLRVVREDGGPIRFRHALVRALAGFFVDFWALGLGGAVAVIVSLSSTKGKRVGDFLAGTVVIRERVPVHGGQVAVMPPQLADWAAGLELSRLPDDLALAVRQYLSRFPELHPGVREGLGRRLAGEVERYVGRAVPLGVPVPAYLSAVLAERRGREQARLARRASAAPAAASQPAPAPAPRGQPPPPEQPPPRQPTPQRPAPDHPFAPPS